MKNPNSFAIIWLSELKISSLAPNLINESLERGEGIYHKSLETTDIEYLPLQTAFVKEIKRIDSIICKYVSGKKIRMFLKNRFFITIKNELNGVGLQILPNDIPFERFQKIIMRHTSQIEIEQLDNIPDMIFSCAEIRCRMVNLLVAVSKLSKQENNQNSLIGATFIHAESAFEIGRDLERFYALQHDQAAQSGHLFVLGGKDSWDLRKEDCEAKHIEIVKKYFDKKSKNPSLSRRKIAQLIAKEKQMGSQYIYKKLPGWIETYKDSSDI